jgi:hypothetical protein
MTEAMADRIPMRAPASRADAPAPGQRHAMSKEAGKPMALRRLTNGL